MALESLNKRLDRMDRYSTNRSRSKNKTKKTLTRLLVLIVILLIAVVLPTRSIYSSAKQLKSSAAAFSTSFKNQNLDDMRANLTTMEDDSSSIDTSLNFLFWMKIIPFISGYYSDAKGYADALDHELKAAKVLTADMEPNKAALGFNGTPTAGQDRIAQLVKILDAVLPNINQVEPELKAANDDVSSIDTSKYPEQFSKYQLRSELDTAKNFIIGSYLAVTQAKPALEIAPSALGDPTPKNYLILFENDKELRATGGFLTAYAFVHLDHGHLSTTGSDDIYTLDTKLLQACQYRVCDLTPPPPIVAYLPEANGKPRTAWSMRDSNLSPDLPTSMQTFERMYGYLGQGIPWDGIITIDTNVVQQMISITGPTTVNGVEYSANIDKRCNCSNVIYELENYSELVEQGQQGRKAILGALMQQVLGKALTTSTTQLPLFINAAAQLASSKHLMFYMHDQATESALAGLGWTGIIAPTNGDYLSINDSNFAGGKSNLYVTESVKLNIDKSTGEHKLTINYDNPQPFGIWLNDINRDYVRVYVPQGSKLISARGTQVAAGTSNELGKTYFDAFVQVRPQNSLVLEFDYTIPQGNYGNPYSLLIQKQPGTKDFSYTVQVNGQTKNFILTTDQNLQI